MSYTEVLFQVEPKDPGSEIIIAQLADIGFESFEETETGVKGYIRIEDFNLQKLKDLEVLNSGHFVVSYSIAEVEDENWNQVWESEYEPVSIQDRVYIHASFHKDKPEMEHSILIDPKMSFGTAHHETTSLLIEEMLKEDFRDATVLDMGCGTAVLAILAEHRGAIKVVGIDNDQNAVDNARENILKNNCRVTSVHFGAAESITGQYDVILANINKNVLVQDMQAYASHLVDNGVILLSGFYVNDLEDLRFVAEETGLAFDKAEIKNSWVVARFVKQ